MSNTMDPREIVINPETPFPFFYTIWKSKFTGLSIRMVKEKP